MVPENIRDNIQEIKNNFKYILKHTKKLAENNGGVVVFDEGKFDKFFSYVEEKANEIFEVMIVFEYIKRASFSYIYNSELKGVNPIKESHLSKINYALLNDEFAILLKIEYNEILHHNIYMEPIRKIELFEVGWFKNFNQFI